MKKSLILIAFLLGFLSFVTPSFGSTLFQDYFHGIDGQLLSQHDSHWFFSTPLGISSSPIFEEYAIFNNMAQDGSGTIFDEDELTTPLTSHFLVSENFIFSPKILTNTNNIFMDIRFYNEDYSNYYALRFWPTGANNSFNVNIENLVAGGYKSSILGNYNHTGNNTIAVEYNAGIINAFINGTSTLSFSDNSLIPAHLVINQVIDTAILTNFQLSDLSSLDLPILLLKQTNPLWASNEYDSAHIWSPNAQTIGNYGCALTSAAMVFKYYGINKLPDGTTLDPGSLNAWLKSQPDGYIGQGYLNWLALSKLSRQAIGVNNITTFDALEYSRTNSEDKTALSNNLQNNTPAILQVNGSTSSSSHFIVAKGVNGSTFDINDPYFSRDTLANGYSNDFVNFGTYSPSQTDLSYMLFTIPVNFYVTVTDQNGKSVGQEVLQNPIEDNINTGSPANPLIFVYVPKPNSGDYSLIVSGPANVPYVLNEYLYDKQGDVQVPNFSGLLNTSPDKYIISFDKDNHNNDTTQKGITLNDLQNDLQNACNSGKIKFGTCTALQAILTVNKNSKPILSIQLNAMMSVLTAQEKWVDQVIYNLLSSDIQYLLTH